MLRINGPIHYLAPLLVRKITLAGATLYSVGSFQVTSFDLADLRGIF
jgi:hypothetical protein